MFDDLTTDDSIESSGDKLGGSKYTPFESGLQDFIIKLAYGSLSKAKAKALNLLMVNDEGKELKATLWLSSNQTKGCLTYYLAKNPKTGKKDVKTYLPGFELANHLCLMTTGKELKQAVTEIKTPMIYDWQAKKEVPTEVPVLMELLGKKVTAGIIAQKVNKRVKDPATGEYVSITDTRIENEISKFFHHPSGLTITEAKAKAKEPIFKQQWADEWTGKVKDRTSDDAIPDPTKEDAATGNTDNTPRKGASLFDGA